MPPGQLPTRETETRPGKGTIARRGPGSSQTPAALRVGELLRAAELAQATSRPTGNQADTQHANRHGKGRGRALASHRRRSGQPGALKPFMDWMPSDPGREMVRSPSGTAGTREPRNCQILQALGSGRTLPVDELTKFTSLPKTILRNFHRFASRHGNGQGRAHGLLPPLLPLLLPSG